MPDYKDMNNRATRVLDNLTGGPGPKRRTPAEQLADYSAKFGDTSWVQQASQAPDLAPGHKALLDIIGTHGVTGLQQYLAAMEKLKRQGVQ